MFELIEQVKGVYSVDPSNNPAKSLKLAILKTIKVSEKYGSMLLSADLSQFDTDTEEYKAVMQSNCEMDKIMEIFLRKCKVKQPKIGTHILNSSVYGYIQRIMCQMDGIKEKAFTSYITNLLIK